jgi:hypothetical protein
VASQAGRVPSWESPLAQVRALVACPVRGRSLCRRLAVLDLGWQRRAQIVLVVCLEVERAREPLALRRFAQEAMDSSPISPYPACHALFQAEYLGYPAKQRQQPAIPWVSQVYRVFRAFCLFQLAFPGRQGCAQRPAWLSRQVEPLGRDGPVLCLFQSALPLRLVKSLDSRQQLALLSLAKRHLRPALSRRRVSGAEYSLDSQS